MGEGIEKERKINNSKQSYIYLKLCGQQARVSGRVCFISKGLIEKRKERNLERGFNPSVGKVKQEQDQQQQQENNKNKRKATTTTHKKYLNSIIIQQRNTKASETKQHKI